MTSEQIVLTGKQLNAIVKECGVNLLSPNPGVDLVQTESDTGGRHLYVRTSKGYFHVSKQGNVVELDD